MQDIVLEPRELARVAVVLILLAAVYIFLFPGPKKLTANETVELCERDNPSYNPAVECQKYVSFKYPQAECKYRLADTVTTDFGLCRNCIVECYG